MTGTMRAVVLDHAPAPPEALAIRDLPIPEPTPGQVLIRVKAFGLNRSELHTRIGLAEGVTFPRMLGIEATGVVEAAPGGEFAVGTQVMTMMGGMAAPSTAGMRSSPWSRPRRCCRSPADSAGTSSVRCRRCCRRGGSADRQVYPFRDIVRAHDDMEHNRVASKLVVTV